MTDYNISFNDMLDDVFITKGWYQGEHFKNGVFVKMGEFGDLHLCEFSQDKIGEQDFGLLPINNGTIEQRYKRVYTQHEIMRKAK